MPRRVSLSTPTRWAALWVIVVGLTCMLTWMTIMQVARDVAMIGGPQLVSVASHASPTAPAPASASSPAGPTPAATPSNDAASLQRTFATRAGAVGAACAADGPMLQSITPADGWQFYHKRDDGELEVEFIKGEAKVEVKISCAGGLPTFAYSD